MIQTSKPPLVTFLVLAFNQEDCVAAAVKGAFAQSYRPLEIILSDDGSSDRTFEIMTQLADEYSGPHIVLVRRSPQNRGLIRHINDCVIECRGEIIIFAAGDDISLSHRTQRLVQRWNEAGGKSAVIYSNFQAMNQNGELVELENETIFGGPFDLETMARGINTPFGATSAATPDVILGIQPISSQVRYEDRVYGFRALLAGGRIIFIDDKLVQYRVHGGISRNWPHDRIDYVRKYARVHHLQRVADARQRLRDTLLLQPDNSRLIRACRATVNDHRLRIIMSDGKKLVRKSLYFLRRGARFAPLVRHFANCEVARARIALRDMLRRL